LEVAGSAVPTLKAFLQAKAAQVASFPATDAGLAMDIDLPEDYERALALAEKRELNPGSIPANNSGTKYESR
jgi:hypothetical protein